MQLRLRTPLLAGLLLGGCLFDDPYYIDHSLSGQTAAQPGSAAAGDSLPGAGAIVADDSAADTAGLTTPNPDAGAPSSDEPAIDDPATDEPATDEPAAAASATDTVSDAGAPRLLDASPGASLDQLDEVPASPTDENPEPPLEAGAEPSTDPPDADVSAPAPNRCGDGVRAEDEACDGPDLAGAACADVSAGAFSGGQLACGDDCEFDTSACVATVRCGNGLAEAGEACDGTDLSSESCATQGFSGGLLRCTAACELDDSDCDFGPDCDEVLPNPLGVVYRGSTVSDSGGSSNDSYSCTNGGRGGDRSLAWTAPESGCYLMVITSDQDLDTIAAVYASCRLSNELSCDDNSGADQFSILEFDAIQNTTYALVVDSYYPSDEGNVTVRVSPCAPAQWTCSADFYGRGDGCDCGCGVQDPDCSGNTASSACEFCTADGSCAEFDNCDAIAEQDNASCN